MKGNRYTGVCIIFVVFSLSVAAFPKTTFSEPVININQKIFDFGTVKEGAVVEHTFRVLNKGDKPLQIKTVKPT